MKNPVVPVLAALALAGCAGPPPPTYGDAFKGLYNQSAASVPANLPVTIQHPVGIIFDNNMELWFESVKQANDYWASVVPSELTNNVVIADTNPMFLNGRVLENLKRRFSDAQLVKDFPAAVASGKRAVCLVDVVVKPMEPYGDRTTKFDITYYFFDAQMNPVSKISGHGEHHVAFGEATGGVQVSVDAALAELDTKMNALVH